MQNKKNRSTIKTILIGQSGGPTAAINASLAGIYQTAKETGIETIYGMRFGIQGFLEEKYVDLSKILRTELDVELLKCTPSSYLGSCRYKLPDKEKQPEIYEKLFSILKNLKVDAFFYIGGNDSMDTIQKLSDYAKENGNETLFIGVPKTIDNDLTATDHTPGYGSAAKFIGTAMKELVRDGLVYNMKSVTVVEIMGRNAGWLAAAAALARGEDSEGPDLIYLPETDFKRDVFLERVSELQKEKEALVIAVSEGIHMADGTYICELAENLGKEDSFGHKILTGTASYLTTEIIKQLGCKTRAVELNTLQRCAAHLLSETDVREAFLCGGAAIKTAFEGKSGVMITFRRISDKPYCCVTDQADIHTIANVERKVPREWINEAGDNVKEEFLTYVEPLIQGELSITMVHGLPRHIPPLSCR